MALTILCGEAAFWLLLASALAVRRRPGRRRLGAGLLLALPALDALLLALAAIDLRSGNPPGAAHALAAIYVGFTSMLGRRAMAGADRWFAHRFAQAPRPARAASRGWAAVRREFALWTRGIAAWAIAGGLGGALLACSSRADRFEQGPLWLGFSLSSIVAWFAFGPLWSLLLLQRAPRGRHRR